MNTEQQAALKDVNLTDVCNFYMGTLALVRDHLTNRDVIANTIIIERDSKLPVSITKRLYTIYEGQETLECSVTQSEGPEENKEFVKELEKMENPFDTKVANALANGEVEMTINKNTK